MINPKPKISWVCSSCGQASAKWSGQCHHCKQWNTLKEEVEIKSGHSKTPTISRASSQVWRLEQVDSIQPQRLSTGMSEIDRLLGGGIVAGSLVLLGGDPGIGKSTLLLQVSANVCQNGHKVLYVSGEESIPQIAMRAQRLGVHSPNLLLVSETRCESIRWHIEQEKPSLVIIDSIQIVYKDDIPSAPGSVTQVRESAAMFLHLAKGHDIPILLIGHVTKSGDLAGPRVLEHMVDTVLYFESDLEAGIRLLRGTKNRFGTTDELAVLQMSTQGLQEVLNPSALFIHQREKNHPGSAVVPTLEGTRALLVETQALVTKSYFPQPTRRASGFDPNRLAVLLAVMEKKAGISLHTCDVFVSIAGGLKIQEPAIDLAIAAAITSSLTNRPLNPHTAVMGEVGLAGELRPVSRAHIRLKELAQMGFHRCVMPNPGQLPEKTSIKIISVQTLKEALNELGCLA